LPFRLPLCGGRPPFPSTPRPLPRWQQGGEALLALDVFTPLIAAGAVREQRLEEIEICEQTVLPQSLLLARRPRRVGEGF
jgi:hypothetical protein